MRYDRTTNQGALILTALLASAVIGQARDFRVSQMPNGSINSCANCHVVASGAGPRNSFGLAVEAKIGGSSAAIPFWDATLAAADSDGDGFSNGVELGDPDGDGTPSTSTGITNPGNASSKPPSNTAPSFTSSPVTTAAIGTAYSYTATATDAQGNLITFSKISGPSWLSVASNGAITGTPQESDTGSVSVTIRATDNATSPLSSDQTYTLTTRATFAGWQKLHFTLPAENAISAASADPDDDGYSNLIEYALRMNPRVQDDYNGETRGFDGGDHFVITQQVRDDAPGLSVTAEISSVLPFASITSVTGVLTDPNGSDGLKTATFTDIITKNSVGARFARFKVSTTE